MGLYIANLMGKICYIHHSSLYFIMYLIWRGRNNKLKGSESQLLDQVSMHLYGFSNIVYDTVNLNLVNAWKLDIDFV